MGVVKLNKPSSLKVGGGGGGMHMPYVHKIFLWSQALRELLNKMIVSGNQQTQSTFVNSRCMTRAEMLTMAHLPKNKQHNTDWLLFFNILILIFYNYKSVQLLIHLSPSSHFTNATSYISYLYRVTFYMLHTASLSSLKRCIPQKWLHKWVGCSPVDIYRVAQK